jgi:hypothetical protein
MTDPQRQIVNARTITRSGVFIDSKELVVAAGYARSGEFGYFICSEGQIQQKNNKIVYEYSGVTSFKKKTNERTLHEVLKEFKAMVDSHKNK